MNITVIINTRNKVEMNYIFITTLLLLCSTHASAAMPVEGDSTSVGEQPMRVVTFKAVPGTARTYYYHRDHLGSTTLITNDSGEVVQRVEYLPTGETYIEQQDTSWVSPYKFNGKELDEETGFYYYGARYYDPRLSLWLGTDPMQGKYPGVSTYAYCMGNPVKFVDPDGKDNYSVNLQGVITLEQKTNDNYDRLSAFTSKTSVIVNDRSVLKQLSKFTNNNYNGSYAITENANDAATLFKFVAENTNVEWRLNGYKEKGQYKFFVGTSHHNNSVKRPSRVMNNLNLYILKSADIFSSV